MSDRLFWGVLIPLAFLVGLCAVGAVWMSTRPEPAPWFYVSEERIPGDRIDLACIQETNREALVSPESVPLRLGDKTRTVCTVVRKEKKP